MIDPLDDPFAADPGGYLRAAADEADHLLAGLSAPPAEGSPMYGERIVIAGRFGMFEWGDPDEPSIGDTGEQMIDGAALHAGRYLSLISKSVRELADAVDRQSFASLPPIVRSHIEFSARASWLVEPIAGDDVEVAIERCCRISLDLFVSLCYQRLTLKALGLPEAGDAQKARNAAVAMLGERFPEPEPQLAWSGVGSETSFALGGLKYVGLAKVSKQFLKTWTPDGSAEGIYDALSGYSHPSPKFLEELQSAIQLADKQVIVWDVDLGFTIRLASYSYQATTRLCDTIAVHMGR